MLKNLKLEHVELTNYSRMRVDLAAQVKIWPHFKFLVSNLLKQVLSQSVANGMEQYGVDGARETVRFIRMFDKAFDCMNVRSLYDKKPERRGYTTAEDDRFSVRNSHQP